MALTMARTLLAHGTEVLVVEPNELLPGLVYPANAGFLYPLEGIPAAWKVFHLANLLPTRAPEREVLPVIHPITLGFTTNEIEGAIRRGRSRFFPQPAAYMPVYTRAD